MAKHTIKHTNEPLDLKSRSLFAKLKKLLSNDVVVRNVGGKLLKIKDTDQIQYATDRNTLRDRFNRVRSSGYSQYSRDFTLAYQASRIELFRDYDCVGPDTIIPLPDGTKPTIKELTEKYKDRPQERFYVYSYDYKTDSIKLGKAFHPRLKGSRIGYKVTFDNGKHIIGSDKHPLLMRNGEYKVVKDLVVGDSLMPFYQKDFFGGGSSSIYNFSKGWQTTHKIVAEQFDRPLTENECVHHKSRSVVSTLNHKIVSIECIGEIDVYDVTVEEYQNFATDSIISHNTMDCDPIIASALDIYADESLTHNELGQVLTIKSDDNNVKQILHNLFYDIMNIEFNLWSWARNMYKYGDFYLKLHITPKFGVTQVEPLSSYNVIRVENSDPQNKSYTKFQVSFESGVMEELENYQVAHFRLISDSNFAPYGKGMIEGARRVWKQLSLMEDAMLIHRVMRAPEKRVFKIDIGNIPPAEVDQYMEKLINKMKKVPYMDEKTGEYNLRFNLQNMVEDFFIPVRGSDSGTSIESLSGMEFTGIDDVQYIRNKMMAALKIPKAFLGYEEELSGKATLANEDVRFAKTIIRLQKILVSELNKIAVVHLFANGFTDESLVNFSLELTNPSTIFEKEKISIWQEKTNLAKDMLESHIFSTDWVYKYVFNISNDDILKIKSQVISDTKQNWRVKEIEDAGNDPATTFKKVSGGESSGDGEKLDTVDTDMSGESEAPPLTERSKRPSQAGEKDARKYPFGEDPLGNMENTAKTRSNPIGHKYQNNSPLSLESVSPNSAKHELNLVMLKDYLADSNVKSTNILLETDSNIDELTKTKKSILDESNIIE